MKWPHLLHCSCARCANLSQKGKRKTKEQYVACPKPHPAFPFCRYEHRLIDDMVAQVRGGLGPAACHRLGAG